MCHLCSFPVTRLLAFDPCPSFLLYFRLIFTSPHSLNLKLEDENVHVGSPSNSTSICLLILLSRRLHCHSNLSPLYLPLAVLSVSHYLATLSSNCLPLSLKCQCRCSATPFLSLPLFLSRSVSLPLIPPVLRDRPSV